MIYRRKTTMGMGLGMHCIQAQRLELTQQLVIRQALQLEGEGEQDELAEIIEKIQRDLSKNEYEDVDSFSDRVMKRIPKEKRTKPVKGFISSLREFISTAKEHPNGIALPAISQTINLTANANAHGYKPAILLDTLKEFFPKAGSGLENILRSGEQIVSASLSPESFYRSILNIEEKSQKTATTQEIYQSLEQILSRYVNSTATIEVMLGDATKKSSLTYSKNQIETLLKLIEQTAELAIPNDITYTSLPVRGFLAEKNLSYLLSKYPNIPLPILAELSFLKTPEKAIKKAEAFASTKDMRNSRDTKRTYLSAIAEIRRSGANTKMIEDVLIKSENMRQCRDILSRFLIAAKIGVVSYDFNLPNGQAILSYLSQKTEYKNPLLKKLSDEAISRLEKAISTPSVAKHLFMIRPLLRLGEVYAEHYPTNLPLLAKLAENVLLDRFESFRYDSKSSKEQLSCLNGEVSEWRKNPSKRRILGETKNLEPQYNVAVEIAKNLSAHYTETFGKELNPQTLVSLKQRYDELSRQRQKVFQKKSQIAEFRKEFDSLDSEYTFANVTHKLLQMSQEEFPNLIGIIAGSLKENTSPGFRAGIDDLARIATQMEIQGIRVVTVRETDAPEEIIQVGVMPVKSCQRYTEKTSYNDCLLAYLTDANKKLIQVLDERNNVRLRSILRLLKEEHHECPLLFLERPYADTLTDDMLKVVLHHAVEKSIRISSETGSQVMLAISDQQYIPLFKKMAETIETSPQEEQISARFNSWNNYEYSDGFGGRIKSGTERSTIARYILIDSEDFQED